MGCVLPIAVHLRDTLLFAYYIVRAMGDVPFGFIEATELHRTIHSATYNKDQDTAQLEARSSGLLLNADTALYFLRRRGAMKGAAAKGTLIRSPRRRDSSVVVFDHFYFFLSEAKVGCHAAAFRLGAAAIALIFSFFGFLVSRLPLCWPFAMSISLGFAECRIGIRNQ
jgi:hypothetical protein